MHILVIGAAGMVGRKFIDAAVKAGGIGEKPVEKLTLVDVVEPQKPAGYGGAVETLAADLSEPGVAEKLVACAPTSSSTWRRSFRRSGGRLREGLSRQFRRHAPSARSHPAGGAEGALHAASHLPSSIAVFGAPFPEPAIPDDFHTTPLTSYGTQKAMVELMINDYSRRGFIDGVSIRLPTIAVRPGKPNLANSGFFSSIIREPLVGLEAVLPVPREIEHWFASPRSAAGFLMHAATLDTAPLGARRAITAPGISASVGEEIEALRRIAGDKAVSLIREEPNEKIFRMVGGWSKKFTPRRALELGFRAETSFDEIIRVHIEDELGGKIGV